jgi:N6-adenosine-specific RNA methylase IME4
MCLLVTHGKPPRRRAAVKKLIVSARREHSGKPDEAYNRIEALCEGAYLAMFARSTRKGWDSCGLEAVTDGSFHPRRWASNSYPEAPMDTSNHSIEAENIWR